MDELSVGKQPVRPHGEDRLDSWKEIAAYLKRDVTTVQRWEKREGMPVHRHLHDRIGSVYATRTELDGWVRSRNLRGVKETDERAPLDDPPGPSPTEAAPRSKNRLLLVWSLAAAAAVTLAIGLGLWLQRTDYFWRNPLADARFQAITEFEGLQQSAGISRDGHFVAFLSDRDGSTDIWAIQVGSGEFHNLTQGKVPDLGNPLIRALQFSPDGSLVTYWSRKPSRSGGGEISVWAVPVLGGEPRPYLEGAAEVDWEPDGSRLVYHTPGSGDPMYVASGSSPSGSPPIFIAPAGIHSHFPIWAPDAAFVYFVQGTLPDKLDIWRIRPTGGTPERITSQAGRISYPVFLDRDTLLYLATDPDGSGPWIYCIDVDRRVPHRLTSGLDRYTSLAASADGHRLVATRATTGLSLWRLHLEDSSEEASKPDRIQLTTATNFAPRVGSGYLLYVSALTTGDSIWRLAGGTARELWHGDDAKVLGAPAISADERQVVFSVLQRGKSLLYVADADGTNLRMVTDTLDLKGSPAWAPDGRSITTAADDHGLPHLFRVPLDGHAPSSILRDYSLDPAWSPDGQFAAYSGPDIGTTFSVKAVTDAGELHALPGLTLTRGARHLCFLSGGHALVFLGGGIQHKDLWLLDLETGVERQLTHLPEDFEIADFDISRDGHDIVLERAQERSDVVLLDLLKR